MKPARFFELIKEGKIHGDISSLHPTLAPMLHGQFVQPKYGGKREKGMLCDHEAFANTWKPNDNDISY